MGMRSGGIVVLGAGYGGLRAALTLDRLLSGRSRPALTLVDRLADHQLITELHRVATGYLPPASAALPLDMALAGTEIMRVQAEVVALDLSARRVLLAGRPALPYSHLVIALGSIGDDHGVPGVHAHALPLRSLDDARRVWAHLQGIQRAARQQETGAAARAGLTTVVIVGAGWTGIEVAGELVSLRGRGEVDLHIVLLDAGAALLPGLPPSLARVAGQFMTAHGIDLRHNHPVVAVGDGWVRTTMGEVAAGTVVWTAGVRGSPVLTDSGLALDGRGCVRVDPYLRAEGQPDVYVVGDTARPAQRELAGSSAVPSAQRALGQGQRAAANLIASLVGGRPLPWRPHSLGVALSLGEDDGALCVGPVIIRRRAAVMLKRAQADEYARSLNHGSAGRRAQPTMP